MEEQPERYDVLMVCLDHGSFRAQVTQQQYQRLQAGECICAEVEDKQAS